MNQATFWLLQILKSVLTSVDACKGFLDTPAAGKVLVCANDIDFLRRLFE